MPIKCVCGSEQFHGSVAHRGLMVDGSGKGVETEISIAECEQCGLKRQVDLPFSTEEEYLKFYETEYPPINEEYGAKTYEEDRDLARLRCDSYGMVRGTVAKILDVGSGSGAFVDECRARGIEAYGCEMCRYSYERGDPFIYRKRLEEVNFPTDHFDVVTCHHVIEHVLDPVGFTKEMFRVTKQRGTCFLEIPRFHHESGKHHWKRIEHIWYFDLPHIERLLTDVGFKVETVEYPVESTAVLKITKPRENRVKILYPPGIGDCYWSIVKTQAFLKREQLGIPDIYIPCPEETDFKTHLRSFPFIEMFPFLNATWKTVDVKAGDDCFIEAYAKHGRTIFKDVMGCDYLISYNGILEAGDSLSNVDRDLECNWYPPRFVSLEEEAFKRDCVKKYGEYVLFHFIFQGSFQQWLNQFPLGEIIQSVRNTVKETGYVPVFSGAAWDVQDEELAELVREIPGAVNLLGKTSVAQLFGLIQGSMSVVGFPSGLTMMAAALGKKTLMIWNNWHRYGLMWNTSPPAVKGKTYFIENTKELTSQQLTDSAVGFITDNKPVDSSRMYSQEKTLAVERCKQYGIDPSDRVLDISSGSGALVDQCREIGAEAYGCEEMRYDYERSDEFIYRKLFLDIQFPTDHFDKIILADTFGHLVDPEAFLKDAFRVLKQGGKCFLTLSGRKSMNVWFYSAAELENLLKTIGFIVRSVDKVESGTLFHLEKPPQKRVKIIVPPGIGDSYWSIVKMQSFLKSKGLGTPDIYIICPRPKELDGHRRSFPFIEMFPFLHSTGEVMVSASDRQGVWNEAYAQQGRTVFENIEGCDYLISYNGHLRFGEALEEIDSLECNWFPPRFVSLEEERFKNDCVEQYGRYMVFHFPLQGTYKHWTNEFSVEKVAKSIRNMARETDCIPVFVGAPWDERIRQEIIKKVNIRTRAPLPRVINLIGKTSIAQLFGVIRGAQAVIGYPCGLTIMATMLGMKTLIVWNNYYHRDFFLNSCPPSTRGQTYFIANTHGLTVSSFVSKAVGLIGGSREEDEKPPEEEKPAEVRKPKRAKKVTVACVLKTGGERDFRNQYVLNLRDSLKRHLTVKHDFVCLTDSGTLPESVPQVPLIHDWPGWWSKMELFRPGLFDDGTVLYFDLGLVILDNLDALATHPHRFTMLRPFNPERRWGTWASGIMAWNGDFSHIYEDFREMKKKPFDGRPGDQVWIYKFLGREPDAIQNVIPGIYSYKRHCRDRLPGDARIVCFHGHPKPHEINEPWMKEHWK